MNMIIHDNKSINYYSLIVHKKSQAFNNNIFVFIMNQKFLPFKVSCSKKVGIFCNDICHNRLKLLPFDVLLVLSELYLKENSVEHQQRRKDKNTTTLTL